MSFTLEKILYGELYQMHQTGPEEQVIPAYLDQLTSYHFSPEPRLFQCSDHFYMQTVVIH